MGLPQSPYRSPSPSSSQSPSLAEDLGFSSPTQKELSQQQAVAIRNLRLAASMQYSSFMARNQPRGSPMRSSCEISEALAATRLPSQPNYRHHARRRYNHPSHSIQPDVGRVRAVFFSG